jgi:hypothetical protein
MISGFRCVRRACCCPTVCTGVVSTAGVKGIGIADVVGATPGNHLSASPDGSVIDACLRRVGRAGWRPAVRSGIVSPTGVKGAADVARSAPDNHRTAGPDGGVIVACLRHVSRAGCCPGVRSWIVSPTGPKVAVVVAKSAPDNHRTAGPDGCV